jgi:hypothetical protein
MKYVTGKFDLAKKLVALTTDNATANYWIADFYANLYF